MMFAQRRNRLATHFSERIPVVKRRIDCIELREEACGGTVPYRDECVGSTLQ